MTDKNSATGAQIDLDRLKAVAESDTSILIPSSTVLELIALARAGQQAGDEWAIYLKEGETPLDRLKREMKDCEAVNALLAKERQISADLRAHLASAQRDAGRRAIAAQCAVIQGFADAMLENGVIAHVDAFKAVTAHLIEKMRHQLTNTTGN